MQSYEDHLFQQKKRALINLTNTLVMCYKSEYCALTNKIISDNQKCFKKKAKYNPFQELKNSL